jgi:phosphoserine phosphatase
MAKRPAALPEDALRRVLEVARHLSASADLKQILAVIIDAMRDLLDARRATVFEYDAATHELFTTVAHGLTVGEDTQHEATGEIRMPADAGLAGESVRSRAIVNVPDAHADPRFNADVDRQTGFRTRSLLTIPLVDHADELVGVAQVLNKSSGAFDAHDEEIAAALASQAAVALRRGRLLEDRIMREKLERDLEVAREIQQRSFPDTLPELDGFELDAWNRPADQTGGDTYDVIQRDGDGSGTVLLMADATGHGVGPALSVTQVRSMLRMALRMDAALEDIAAHLNRQLHADLPTGRFVTAWLGELDVDAHTIASLSAGQAPLLAYRAATDTVESFAADTVPLGILPDQAFEIGRRVVLEPGDIFLVASDGIYEAMRPGDNEEFGEARVRELLRDQADESAKRIARVIRRSVRTFTENAPAGDDRTMIVIKRQA